MSAGAASASSANAACVLRKRRSPSAQTSAAVGAGVDGAAVGDDVGGSGTGVGAAVGASACAKTRVAPASPLSCQPTATTPPPALIASDSWPEL